MIILKIFYELSWTIQHFPHQGALICAGYNYKKYFIYCSFQKYLYHGKNFKKI